MKSFLKNILVGILGNQVKRLRKRNSFKTVGVVGSIGKTSTKLAIVEVLKSEKKVQYQEGNYNDILSVPLIFFGRPMPDLFNIFEWALIIIKNEFIIYSKYPYDVVVLELGTDHPGDINKFRKYLHLDITVVTAVTPEHMEFFSDIGEVGSEEWSVNYFSDLIFANKDLCLNIPPNIDHKKVVFYGKEFGTVYKIENIEKVKDSFNFDISENGKKLISLSHPAISEIQLYSACAAFMVAKKFNILDRRIEESIKKVKSFPGRMQRLKGIKNSTIIDDTYNASPIAVKVALHTLYSFDSPQRIAILGMMNELGDSSEKEHTEIGKYCNPKFLDLVVTVGKDAIFIARAARENGCLVYEAKDAVDAGRFVKNKIKAAEEGGAVMLAKGSQNGVFAEEALKPLLADPSLSSLLVRQDKYWMKKKEYLYK